MVTWKISECQFVVEGFLLEPEYSVNILCLTLTFTIFEAPRTVHCWKCLLDFFFFFQISDFFFFTFFQLLKLCKGLIRPCFGDCHNIWGCAPSTRILDAVQRKATHLINSPKLTSAREYLKHPMQSCMSNSFYRDIFIVLAHRKLWVMFPHSFPDLRILMGRFMPTVTVFQFLTPG